MSKFAARILVALIALALVLPAARLFAAPMTFVVVALALPGDAVATTNGVFILQWDGTIIRNEVLIAGSARKLLAVNDQLYAQGKTNPAWWRWTPTGWQAGSISLDTLAALAAAP